MTHTTDGAAIAAPSAFRRLRGRPIHSYECSRVEGLEALRELLGFYVQSRTWWPPSSTQSWTRWRLDKALGFLSHAEPRERREVENIDDQGRRVPDEGSQPRRLERLHPRSLKHLSEHLRSLVEGRLWLKVLIGMALGLIVGTLIGPGAGLVDPQRGAVIGNWLAFPGRLFLAAIQMIVIPLVVASVIRGLAASEDPEQLRQMGVRVTLFFTATTAVAAAIGLQLARMVRPGRSLDPNAIATLAVQRPPVGSEPVAAPELAHLPDALLGLLPGNPLNSMVQGEMLQVVIFSIIVGVALVSMAPAQSKPILDLLGSLQQVCMTVVRWALLLAPFAVFGLMAQLASKIGFDALLGMAVYVLTVLAGLLVLLAIYLILVFVFARWKPLAFLAATREVLLLAFSTSSSAAVMPLSIKTAEEKLNVRPSISQFVIPLGATINMNGTALYQGVATAFLAQVYGIELSFESMVLVVAMAVGASIGSPATPGVGIVILAMVLESVGIPSVGIALIMGVDRILDMSRTAINVAGDLVTSTLMDRWVGSKAGRAQELAEQDTLDERRRATGEDVLTDQPPVSSGSP